jgi:HAE1 family hydrophobic/amphiphilic exporter-1
MTLADRAIRNPVFAWMLMFGLIFFGVISYNRMGMGLMPDVDAPVISVSARMEGAAPEVMETEIVDQIEEAIMGIEGVKEVSSSARYGRASISVEFVLSKNIDVALQEIQARLAQITRDLPREMDPVEFHKRNPEDQPILWISLRGKKPLRELMEYTRDHLKDRFQTISGVGEVFLGGFTDPALRIWLDTQKMERLEITVDDVMNAIQMQHVELPAGLIEGRKQEQNIRVVGEAGDVKEFENIIIPARSGGGPIYRTLRLKDVGRVEEGLADIRNLSRTMGETAVGLGIRKQRGSNAVAVAHEVKKRLAEAQKELPAGMELTMNFDTTKFTEEAVGEMNFTLILSAILTSLVCWFFLGSWTATINILLAIPTSIIGSFIVIYFLGFTLNTFTILGLTLAVGIVVDDAIMMLENISRYRERGMSRIKAAMTGANEITFAALATSIAVLAIFVPVAFMSGIIGKYFFQFGVTMSVAVLLSLLEALTLTPMRTSQFLEVGRRTFLGRGVDQGMDALRRGYRYTLSGALKYRWLVMVAAAAFFFASYFQFLPRLKKEFMPPQDQGILLVRFQAPPGSSLAYTDTAMKQIEDYLSRRPEVLRYFGSIGGMGGGDVNTGMMFVTLKPFKERPVAPPRKKPLTQQELMGAWRADLNKIQGLRKVVIQDPSMAGFASMRGFPIEFTVRGPDWDRLVGHSQEIMKRMEDSGLMVDIDTDYVIGAPEIRVIPDREACGEYGVDVATVARAINSLIGGVRVGQYTEGDRRYDIRVRLASKERENTKDIGRIWIRNNRGELLRLSQLVKVTEKPTVVSITRRNRERAVGITANIAPGKSQAEAIAAVEKIGKQILPEDYRTVLAGSAQTFTESFQSLIFALILGIVVAYMVLGSQFKSFVHPVTVLLALPFSVSGAFIALYLADRSLNIYSMIGLILLMGIVKKNSILLVDFTNKRREQGMDLQEALLDACPIRLRPILMTSVATIAAAIPPALALGPGAEIRIPMAIAVIGGVLVSTLLTLFVVPCAMTIFARLESKRHWEELRSVLKEMGQDK